MKMKRSEFFKKSILGAFAVWKSPEILESISNSSLVTPSVVFPSFPYGGIEHARYLQKEFNRNIQRQLLFGIDIDDPQWTPEQVEILKRTRRKKSCQMETISPRI